MSVEGIRRGDQLLEGSHRIHTGPELIARVFAGGGHKLLDEVDRGLLRGSLTAYLPDGGTRTMGGHAPGFEADIHIKDWRALLRLATGGSAGFYQAWEEGEWDSRDPVALFALVMQNGTTMGETGRAKGPYATSMRITISATISTERGSIRR
jgi:cyclopropane-fatty-acyl-phospholipid synthase